MTTLPASAEVSMQSPPMSPTMSEVSSQLVALSDTSQEPTATMSNSGYTRRGGRGTRLGTGPRRLTQPYQPASSSTTWTPPTVTGKRQSNGSLVSLRPPGVTRTKSMYDLGEVPPARAPGFTRAASRAALSSTVAHDNMEDGELSDSDLEDHSDEDSFEEFEVAIDEDCNCEACRWNFAKSKEYEELEK